MTIRREGPQGKQNAEYNRYPQYPRRLILLDDAWRQIQRSHTLVRHVDQPRASLPQRRHWRRADWEVHRLVAARRQGQASQGNIGELRRIGNVSGERGIVLEVEAQVRAMVTVHVADDAGLDGSIVGGGGRGSRLLVGHRVDYGMMRGGKERGGGLAVVV